MHTMYSDKWREVYPVFGKRHIMTIDKSSDGLRWLCMACPGSTCDCFFPMSVKHSVNLLIASTCLQNCQLNYRRYTALSGFPSETSNDNKARWGVMKSQFCLGMCCVNISASENLFPVLSVPFISTSDTGTGRSSWFRIDYMDLYQVSWPKIHSLKLA